MPLIKFIPETKDEPEERPDIDPDYIKAYLDVPSWKCTCGLTNFGRNKKCANWRCGNACPNQQ